MKKIRNCPECGTVLGNWHRTGCQWEQCPYCGGQLAGCGHAPPLDDRLPWTGSNFWFKACLELGFFRKRVHGVWISCRADDPDSRPDVDRLLRQCFWNRMEKRFERRRKVKG
jgi:hypothetical protein